MDISFGIAELTLRDRIKAKGPIEQESSAQTRAITNTAESRLFDFL